MSVDELKMKIANVENARAQAYVDKDDAMYGSLRSTLLALNKALDEAEIREGTITSALAQREERKHDSAAEIRSKIEKLEYSLTQSSGTRGFRSKTSIMSEIVALENELNLALKREQEITSALPVPADIDEQIANVHNQLEMARISSDLGNVRELEAALRALRERAAAPVPESKTFEPKQALEETFPKAGLNACLTALVNTIGIPQHMWERWQLELYMLSKMLNNLQIAYHPISEQMVGSGTFRELSKMEGGLRPGCMLMNNASSDWKEPRIAAKCFRDGSMQRGRDQNVYVATGNKWMLVKMNSVLKRDLKDQVADLSVASEYVSDAAFQSVLQSLRSAKPQNPFRDNDPGSYLAIPGL